MDTVWAAWSWAWEGEGWIFCHNSLMATALFSLGKLGCNPFLSSSLKSVSQKEVSKLRSVLEERRGVWTPPVLFPALLSHMVPRSNRTLKSVTTRESAETKLSCAPVSQLKQHPHPASLTGRPFRWIVITFNTLFLLLEHTAGMVTVQVLQSFLQAAGLHVMGHHALFWVTAAEGHSPAQTRNSNSKCSRRSGEGTLCFALGQCCWRTQPGSNKKQNAACLIIQLLPTTVPMQVIGTAA